MWMLLVVLIALGAYALAQRRRAQVRSPPLYPGALPLIGHAHLFAKGNSADLWNLTKEMAETTLIWGGIMRFQLGTEQVYVISDPDDCVTVANSCFHKDFIYDFMKPALGNGLLTADEPIWKVHRKLLKPAFFQVVLDGFIDLFNSQARKLVVALDQEAGKEPFDSWKHLGPNALETVCLTAMGGAKADGTLTAEYLHATGSVMNFVIQRFQKFWLYSDITYKFSSLSKKMEKDSKIMHDVSDSILQDRKRSLSEDTKITSGTKYKAFIDLILECSGEKGLLSDQEIREEVDTTVVAGHETSAAALLYVMLMLGTHPEVQERVFNEIAEVIGDRDVGKQDLPKLVYLEAVLKETLRLYPSAPIVVRKLKEDLKLKNYTLPAGSGVYLAIYALHRHEMWGADAGQFVPERWLDKARVPTHQAAFAAFSLGRRMCIGKNYALMGMKTTLVHVVRSFSIKADASKLRLKLDILLKPHSGHYISVVRRT